jgi:hypothetical protein
MAGNDLCSDVMYVKYKLVSADDRVCRSHECEQWLLHIPLTFRYHNSAVRPQSVFVTYCDMASESRNSEVIIDVHC